MKKIVLFGIVPCFLLACGGASHGAKRSVLADQAYAPTQMSAEAPAEYAEEAAYDDAGGEYYGGNAADLEMEKSIPGDGSYSAPSPAPSYYKKDASQQASKTTQQMPQEPDKLQSKGPKPDGPMIVYNGYLHLRVKRLLDALDKISEITKEAGGYVDSMTKTSIVVRIPGERFDEMMAAFSKLGDLLSKEISAIEVTAQYTDLQARLAVAEEAKARLLSLLEKVQKADERLRILEEIKRLSEQIESIKSTLATLQNLMKYFTVTIDLTPILEDDAAIQHQSPFEWVRDLSAHRMTLFGGAKQFSMKLPSDFVLFTKDEDYRAQAADTTIIRGGVVNNDPRGTKEFWTNAVSYEMKGRSESLEKKGTAGQISYLLFKNADLQPRWYLIGVAVIKDKVMVVEVFFPNETAFQAHKDDVLDTLKTFEVTK